jgi:rod shape determining protein RodA
MPLQTRLLKRLDWHLLASVGIVLLVGLFVLYSATFDQSINPANAFSYLWKQLLALVFGLLLMCGIIYMDYHVLENYAEVFYVFTISLLLIVINIGHTLTGAQRWLTFGPLTFQPSELAKLALIIILAKYLSARKKASVELADILPCLLLVALPFLLVFKQPDLGTSIIFLLLFISISYWSGTDTILLFFIISPLLSIIILYGIHFLPWFFWIIYLLLLLTVMHYRQINLIDSAVFFLINIFSGFVSPFLWQSLKTYQQQRLLGFLNPMVDPLGQSTRYHATKSVIAIGSGSIFGQGFLKGPLTHLQYIPEHHTDFIFTVLGEEFGLLGTLLIIGLFCYIIFRGIRIATSAQDEFGSLLAAGAVFLLAFQIVLNIGMTIGFFPVVGIPLPFLSAGGSALIVNLFAIGILESVAIHQKKLFF